MGWRSPCTKETYLNKLPSVELDKMTGKGRALVFISIAGAVLVPGIVLAFVFLHFWFALFASMFVALAIFGMVFGSRSPRRDRLNQLEAEAAKKGDMSFFINPRRPW